METVGTAMLNEQPHLLPLAAEPFDLAEISFPTVDSLRCVRVRTTATRFRCRRNSPDKPCVAQLQPQLRPKFVHKFVIEER